MPRANSHAALMRWRLAELTEHADDLARKLRTRAITTGLDKRGLAHLIVELERKLSVRDARLGD